MSDSFIINNRNQDRNRRNRVEYWESYNWNNRKYYWRREYNKGKNEVEKILSIEKRNLWSLNFLIDMAIENQELNIEIKDEAQNTDMGMINET